MASQDSTTQHRESHTSNPSYYAVIDPYGTGGDSGGEVGESGDMVSPRVNSVPARASYTSHREAFIAGRRDSRAKWDTVHPWLRGASRMGRWGLRAIIAGVVLALVTGPFGLAIAVAGWLMCVTGAIMYISYPIIGLLWENPHR